MANQRLKNVLYIDTLGTVTVDAMKPVCFGVMITPADDNARVTIKESVGGMIVIDVLIQLQETRFLDFGDLFGIELNSNFEVAALDNVSTVIMYGSWGSPVNKAR